LKITAKNKGFTLIELLIVMAILGVLAVVVLVAINPVQQLARTRDAGRKSGVSQLGRAMEAYYTSHGGSYADETTTPLWVQVLVDSGELSVVPTAINPGVSGYTACTESPHSGWCYDSNDDAGEEPVVVYTKLESESEMSKCSGNDAYFVWSTADGRGGLVCTTAPTPGTQTFVD
jgi:prepilin-type N-terminal cleavage/methylation domain-containing protein